MRSSKRAPWKGAIFSTKKPNTIRNMSPRNGSKLAGVGLLAVLPEQGGDNAEKL